MRLDNSDNYESNLELVTPTSSKERDQSIQRTENHLCGSWRDRVQTGTVLGQPNVVEFAGMLHTNENTALDFWVFLVFCVFPKN